MKPFTGNGYNTSISNDPMLCSIIKLFLVDAGIAYNRLKKRILPEID
ncbi:MAG: hypothetical protein NT126_05185 [Bacteroidetes bacterium]|nr:hypothetical protein [Bacteroidota bacterium]